MSYKFLQLICISSTKNLVGKLVRRALRLPPYMRKPLMRYQNHRRKIQFVIPKINVKLQENLGNDRMELDQVFNHTILTHW